MNPITGMCIDGPAKGTIITATRVPFIVDRMEPVTFDPGKPVTDEDVVPVTRVMYYEHRLRVANRLYVMYSTISAPTLFSPDVALIALIDADAADARRCQQPTPADVPDITRPHSRACGIIRHEHGRRCSPDCPTCLGEDYR